MKIFKKRYALLGWATWRLGKRRIKRQIGRA